MISDLENRLQSSENTLTEVKGQQEELEAQLTMLQSTLLSREGDIKKSKVMLDEFREALEKAQKSIKDIATDRDRQMKKRVHLCMYMYAFEIKIEKNYTILIVVKI